MVCHRCKLAVADELKKLQLHPVAVELGEVSIEEPSMSEQQLETLRKNLSQIGFELLDDKRRKIIEKIKSLIIEMVHYPSEGRKKKFSTIIAENLHHDYSYLSALFSSVEGITIEQYIINQKIEKVKELLVYDELSLSEIAFRLQYSSVAHLSAQFKKVTGLTPTAFKQMGHGNRAALDSI